LAYALAGSDENSAADIAVAMLGLRQIQRRTGAAILLVHHSLKKGPEERGSSALRGAMDTMLAMEKKGRHVTVQCNKQKDAAEAEPLTLELAPTAESCVLIAPPPSYGASGLMQGSSAFQTLRALHDIALDDGVTCSQWEAASNLPQSTFMKHRRALVMDAYVDGLGTTNRKRYRLTPKGENVVATYSNFAPR
jgi:hypothetical protein